jgi:hypothetical protein
MESHFCGRNASMHRLAYTPRTPLVDQWDIVRAYLDTQAEIGRAGAAQLLRVNQVRASQVLSEPYHQRLLLVPVGNPRGRGICHRLAATVATLPQSG